MEKLNKLLREMRSFQTLGYFTNDHWQNLLNDAETEAKISQPQALQEENDRLTLKVSDLAILVRILARHLPTTDKARQHALDYLTRHNLQGSPLRSDIK